MRFVRAHNAGRVLLFASTEVDKPACVVLAPGDCCYVEKTFVFWTIGGVEGTLQLALAEGGSHARDFQLVAGERASAGELISG